MSEPTKAQWPNWEKAREPLLHLPTGRSGIWIGLTNVGPYGATGGISIVRIGLADGSVIEDDRRAFVSTRDE